MGQVLLHIRGPLVKISSNFLFLGLTNKRYQSRWYNIERTHTWRGDCWSSSMNWSPTLCKNEQVEKHINHKDSQAYNLKILGWRGGIKFSFYYIILFFINRELSVLLTHNSSNSFYKLKFYVGSGHSLGEVTFKSHISTRIKLNLPSNC